MSNKSPAYWAAVRSIDMFVDVNLAAREEVTNAHDLYAAALLLGQAAAVEHVVLPPFQTAYGEDLQELVPGVCHALKSSPCLTLSPFGPPPGSDVRLLRLTDGANTLFIPACGIPNLIPARFVAALADYAFGCLTRRCAPLQDIHHHCQGHPDDWLELSRQAHQHART